MAKSLSIVYNHSFAAKYPNVFRRSYGTLVEGKRSTAIPLSGVRNAII